MGRAFSQAFILRKLKVKLISNRKVFTPTNKQTNKKAQLRLKQNQAWHSGLDTCLPLSLSTANLCPPLSGPNHVILIQPPLSSPRKLPVPARGDVLPLQGCSKKHPRALESPLPVKALPGFWDLCLPSEVAAAGHTNLSLYS